jgi:anti-sigma-K factor RskA
MNCDQAEGLLGAYALDALPPDEAQAVREHLAGCARHASEAAELRAVAARLPAAAEPRNPPPELRERVLAAIAHEPQAAATPSASVSPATEPRRIETARSRVSWGTPGRRSSFGWGALAAVVVAAFVGLLAWNFVLLNRLDGESDLERLALSATSVSALQTADGETAGSVIYFDDDKMAVVVGAGMEQLGDDRTYQLWAIDGGAPQSIGLMEPGEDGSATVTVPFDAGASTVLAITIEPAGGSPAPTGDPVMTAEV